MPRTSVDITGAGSHSIATPGPTQRIMMREVFVTFAHNQPTALRVWFKFGTRIIGGPFFVTDGGDIRYRKTESPNTYQGEPGETFSIQLDPNLSCAGFIDYEVGAW